MTVGCICLKIKRNLRNPSWDGFFQNQLVRKVSKALESVGYNLSNGVRILLVLPLPFVFADTSNGATEVLMNYTRRVKHSTGRVLNHFSQVGLFTNSARFQKCGPLKWNVL